MTISALVEKLQALKSEHGDVEVVTSGFDESDYDLIETVEPVSLICKPYPANHSGQYKERAMTLRMSIATRTKIPFPTRCMCFSISELYGS